MIIRIRRLAERVRASTPPLIAARLYAAGASERDQCCETSGAQVVSPDATRWLDVACQHNRSSGANPYVWFDARNGSVAMMFAQLARIGHPNTYETGIRNPVYAPFESAHVPAR